MVSHDLPSSKVANQISFDQRDLYRTSKFERAMGRRCQLLETLDTITLPVLWDGLVSHIVLINFLWWIQRVVHQVVHSGIAIMAVAPRRCNGGFSSKSDTFFLKQA